MDINFYPEYNFLLGSKSPRRQQLLKSVGLPFEIVQMEVEENYPDSLQGADIALYLCELKAEAFDMEEYPDNSVLITADTIVWLENECIGKPKDREDAIQMLSKLSGKEHTVYTGICLRTKSKKRVFSAETQVKFKTLSPDEIRYYIEHHRPFDKAGSYGIQDWIGYTSVIGIKGCYYNVMGFPVQKFWEELNTYLK
ncbi:MAG: septum formation protein Maf [Bacteroidales bacterium]|nr:septum formation protein Maf [Bacteroidales bacterium]